MAFVIEKKLKNVMTFYYLMKLDKKIPTDRNFIRKRQGKKVHELMKCAYQIPFYRKRFKENHLTPDDFHTPEDLVKFPITTRADLRLWMQEEYEKHPEPFCQPSHFANIEFCLIARLDSRFTCLTKSETAIVGGIDTQI